MPVITMSDSILSKHAVDQELGYSEEHMNKNGCNIDHIFKYNLTV